MKTMTALALAACLTLACGKKDKQAEAKRYKVERGDIVVATSANGTVEPLNKVRVLPPVSGRVEQVLVAEGAYVRKGQVLAMMSSTERAALLDGARSLGEAEVAKWEDTYRPTAVLSPVGGTIIFRNVVSGQTVTMGEVLYELSDRLIVLADLDETDLAKVHVGQRADVSLDAYPGKDFKAAVSLVSGSSQKVNNVITYKVRLEPEKAPGFLRAGMTANIRFIQTSRLGVLILPLEAVQGQQGQATLAVAAPAGAKPQARKVELGEDDGASIEVRGGLKEGEEVVAAGLDLPSAAAGGLFGGMRPSRTPTAPRGRGNRGGGARRSGASH